MEEAAQSDVSSEYFCPTDARMTPPDPQAAGAFIGIKSTTTRGAMCRAVLEGLAFEARAIADAMVTSASLPAFKKILTVGTSLPEPTSIHSRSKADLHGLPVSINPVRETSSLGAALLAGMGCGLFANASAAQRAARQEEIHIEPNLERSSTTCRRATRKSTEIFMGNFKRRTIGCMLWLDGYRVTSGEHRYKATVAGR